MTTDEFFASLEEIPFWKFLHGGKLRHFVGGRGYQYTCPICAVAWKEKQVEYDVGKWYRAAEELQLDMEVAKNIMAASDNQSDCHPIYRRKLLDACIGKEYHRVEVDHNNG